MKTRMWINLLGFALLLLTFPALHTMRTAVHSERVFHNSRVSPIIFIPGSSASQDRFDDLFQTFNHPKSKHSILKITVDTKNQIHHQGVIAARDRQPLIVIAFQNNHDGYTNIAHQTQWLQTAMNYLTNKYNFNNFYAIGHSNGGLNWTWYLEKYFNSNNLTVNALMTIGTPYNSLESNFKNQTAIFRQLYQHRQKLPHNMIVYSIAGTTNYENDGIVPYQSVEAAKYIFQKQVRKYTQITVTGHESNHSSLLANPEVARLIQSNILDSNLNNPNIKKP